MFCARLAGCALLVLKSSVVEMPEALRLFRQLLRASRGFEDYNLRHYAIRRCRQAFEEGRPETDAATITNMLADGKKQLQVLQRQATINNLYSTERSVMDTLQK